MKMQSKKMDAEPGIGSRSLPASLFMAALFYGAYGFGTSKWGSPWLVSISLAVGLSAPAYAGFINRVDAGLYLKSGFVTVGRLGRFAVHMLFNAILFLAMVQGGILLASHLEKIGGPIGAALYTTLAAQGAQYIAVILANRNIGSRDWNIFLCGFLIVFITALAMVGYPVIQSAFTRSSLLLGTVIFAAGVVEDMRSCLRRR